MSNENEIKVAKKWFVELSNVMQNACSLGYDLPLFSSGNLTDSQILEIYRKEHDR
ncbi:hypothetical protein SAMN04489761_0859 [Tenacibaculum sp. MAR_2009_124]|uniref:hypothetical protein n=1 Tax=Tenacibaculum sp. MAR_2009_124 TaxID=1250059 RepID=UPI00089D3B10|nr:hypothetical protein [Tenacibaculum sp. MAR_2009_124]SEB46218.1 hypothetical protein SAMN04489761_0859 [Tenacibaculum sp. MAR_2009_124]